MNKVVINPRQGGKSLQRKLEVEALAVYYKSGCTPQELLDYCNDFAHGITQALIIGNECINSSQENLKSALKGEPIIPFDESKGNALRETIAIVQEFELKIAQAKIKQGNENG